MSRIVPMSFLILALFVFSGCQSEKGTGEEKEKDTKADSADAIQMEVGHPPESKEARTRQATLPLPKGERDSATVLDRGSGNGLDTLRMGSNEWICLSDDPKKDGFKVDCYHKALDAFMDMGRRLERKGMSRKKIFQERKRAIENGEIQMPDKKNLIVLTGKYDADGKVVDRYRRHVLYIPYATSTSTGLPTEPMGKGEPWLMDAGTHKAHIMVNPVE